MVNPSVHVIHRRFKHDSVSACIGTKACLFTHFKKKKQKTPKHKVEYTLCAGARTFISSIVELRGARLIRGLPRGVSSLVECTVVGADVAAVRGYSVVSMVRLGTISCTYLLRSAYCFVVWCGDSEAVSTDLWKILLLQCVSSECAVPELLLNSALLWNQLLCMSKVSLRPWLGGWFGFLVSRLTGDKVISHKHWVWARQSLQNNLIV